MERISDFKTFSANSAEKAAVRLSEENEVKRSEIAEKVKAVLNEMEISSLTDLSEEQKQDFIDRLFTEKEVEEIVEDDAKVDSDEEFTEYATTLLKKAFGEEYDEEKASNTITGIIKKYDGDYGAMVGALQSSLD